jgi:hypothetical protein
MRLESMTKIAEKNETERKKVKTAKSSLQFSSIPSCLIDSKEKIKSRKGGMKKSRLTDYEFHFLYQ